MFCKNIIMVTLVILSMVLLPSTTTNALAISNDNKLSDVDVDVLHTNYTIKGDNVILHSIFGQMEIPIPEKIKSELKSGKLRAFTDGSMYDTTHSHESADFFECNEQAQIALSTHSANYRDWEAYFKRNSIENTIAVRYCCNLLEYIENAQDTLSPQCKGQVRMQDHVMTIPEVRHTCRQYEFHTMECFLVRWMYWWIPLLSLILIALFICCCCWAISCRRSKSYSAPAEDKHHRRSLVTRHSSS